MRSISVNQENKIIQQLLHDKTIDFIYVTHMAKESKQELTDFKLIIISDTYIRCSALKKRWIIISGNFWLHRFNVSNLCPQIIHKQSSWSFHFQTKYTFFCLFCQNYLFFFLFSLLHIYIRVCMCLHVL